MSNVSVIFDADTGRFVSNVGNAEKSVLKASEQVAKAKNATLEWTQSSVEAAKAAGASYEQLNRIMTRGSARLASITEQNATRIVNARNREIAKTKELAVAQAELGKVISIEQGKEAHSWKHGAEITRRQMASGLIRASSGQSSLRAAEVFTTMLPGFDAVASTVFPIVGAIAFGSAILGCVNRLMEMQQEEYQVKLAQDAFGLSVKQTFASYQEKLLQAQIQTDDLTGNHIDALRKQLQLIDEQGFDNLSSTFSSLAKNATSVFQTIKANWLDTIVALTYGHWGAVGSKGVAASSARFQNQYETYLAEGNPVAAQNFLNATQNREEGLYALLGKMVNTPSQSGPANGPAKFFGPDAAQITAQELEDKYGIKVDGAGDLKKRYEAEGPFVKSLEAQQVAAAKNRQTTGIDKHNTILGANQAAATAATAAATAAAHSSAQKQAAEQRDAGAVMRDLQMMLERGKAAGKYQSTGEVESFWASAMRRYGSALPTKTNQYLKSDVQHEYYAAQVTAAHELTAGAAALQRWAQTVDAKGVESLRQQAVEAEQQKRAQTTLADAAAKSSLSSTLDSIKALVTHGYISTATGAQREMSAYQRYGRTTGLLTSNTSEGIQLRAHISALEDQLEPVIDQLFDHIRVQAQQTSKQIMQIGETLIGGINDQLATGMMGGWKRGQTRQDFGRVFQTAGTSLAKTGLQRAEGLLLFGNAHGNKPPKGTTNDRIHVTTQAEEGGAGIMSKHGLGSILGHITGGGKSGGLMGMFGKWANNSNFMGSLFGGKLFGSGGIFSSLGHFALGGPVAAGVPVITGELGREMFVPSTPGTIIPHKDAFGSTNNNYIDARGAHDPAQTYAAVHRAMRPYVAASGPASIAAHRDQQRRTPQHSKR